MKEGDIVLTPLQQANSTIKSRPALALRELPPYRDMLVCGISTQLNPAVTGFDEMLCHADPDFPGSGRVPDSVIRLGFLSVLPRRKVMGSIGAVSVERHARLLTRLSAYLAEKVRAEPR